MKIIVNWPEHDYMTKRVYNTSDVCDELSISSMLKRVTELSYTYDVIIDNGVISFVEKS